MRKHIITIAGNIGVGKSSLTQLLADELGWVAIFEAVEENPYLADFYRDMRTWSFHSQTFFLSRRLFQYREMLDCAHSIVQDRSIYEDAEIFARNLHLQGHLDGRDYDLYRQLYEGISLFLPVPTFLVYLRASLETLQQRIASRGRDYERAIDPAYIARLNELYEEWIARFDRCPVLTIEVDGLDFVHRSDDGAQVVQRIREMLRTTTVTQSP